MDYEISFSIPYDEPCPESEDPLLPPSSTAISGLSSFFALAIRLNVPILTATISHERWGRSTLGTGTSFHVARSYSSRQIAYLGPNSTIDGNPSGLGERLKSCGGLVSKRLCRKAQHDDDRRNLVPLVQELRVLSHATLRDAPNLVRMLCVDWSGDSTDIVGGRCWPSLLLECATHGTLAQYLLRSPRPSWDLKWALCLNIADGLMVLHEHNVVSCDLKLDNILVFENAGSELAGVDVVAKISDFGYSLITSDYNEQAVFPGRAGTPPWNAPELAFGRGPRVHALEKADIYTMGLIVCTIILEGHPPWEKTSASVFQDLKETDDDAGVSAFLAAALAEAITQQQETIWHILDATVKSDPNDRCSAWDLLGRITLASVEPILNPGEATPDEAAMLTANKKAKAVLNSRWEGPPTELLPNIFSTGFKDADFQPFIGVPNFEDTARFKPCLFYNPALLEVTNDLSRRADGLRGESTRTVAEAEYQLCICYLEGYGVAQSVPDGLTYLARAFNHGSPKARRATRNFYEAFGHSLPQSMADTEEADLLTAAGQEADAPDDLHEDWIASEALRYRYPNRYAAWITSNEFRNMRLQQFAYTAAIHAATTDGLDLGGMVAGLTELVIDVVHTPGPNSLSTLHHAAALGDACSVSSLLRANHDVNAVTPHLGWTPLWMACAGGYFDAACVLLAGGADVCCRERSSGRGILHLLRAFRERSEVEYIVRKAQEAGLDINNADSEAATPLFAALEGSNLSGGAAARVLLERGANPFLKNRHGVHPFGVCVVGANHDLLRAMLACPAAKAAPKAILWDAMAAALGALISQSPVVQLSRLGGRWEAVIKDVLTQLLSEESTQRFLLHPLTRGQSPVAAAVWLDRQTLAHWLMELRPQDVDLCGETSRTALQWAVTRGRVRLVEQLLKHGADPLIADDMGYNALHVAAVSMPSAMPSLADAIVRSHCGSNPETAESWLDRRDAHGFTPFGLAVFEGGEEHLRYAEILREKYQLAHDFSIGERGITLLGSIVLVGAVADTASLAPVEYLLRLRPQPRFVADADGSTLLHHAVVGWKNAAYSDGAVGYDILALLLREFSSQEHLQARDRHGATAIMKAASCVNHIAITMLREHAAACGFSLDINLTESGGATALDGVGGHALMLALGDELDANESPAEGARPPLSERASELDPGTLQLLVNNIRRTNEILLELGAVSSEQLNEITIWALIASPISIPHESRVKFLAAMKQAHAGLDVDLPEANPPPSYVGSHISLDCFWRMSSFVLSIHIFENIADAKAHTAERIHTGKLLLESWMSEHGECPLLPYPLLSLSAANGTQAGTKPWAATRSTSEGGVTWERPGRVWGLREIVELHQDVKRAWVGVTACQDLVVMV